MSINYYQVLDVDYSIGQSELKIKYRNLVKSLHPDLHSGNIKYQEKIAEINNAYDILSDQDKRYQYDLLEIRSLLQQQAYSKAALWAEGCLRNFSQKKEIHELYKDCGALWIESAGKKSSTILKRFLSNKYLHLADKRSLQVFHDNQNSRLTEKKTVNKKPITTIHQPKGKVIYYFLLALRNNIVFISWLYYALARFSKIVVLWSFNLLLNILIAVAPGFIVRIFYVIEKGVYIIFEFLLDLVYRMINFFVNRLVYYIDTCLMRVNG